MSGYFIALSHGLFFFLSHNITHFFMKNIFTLDRVRCFLRYWSVKMFLKTFSFLHKVTENRWISLKNVQKKRNMFLRFQRIALDVSYGFGRNRSMFLIVVFLIKKSVYCHIMLSSAWNFSALNAKKRCEYLHYQSSRS